MKITRRKFVGALAGAGIAAGLARESNAADPKHALPAATAAALPRWRGFNLLEKFNSGNARPFVEQDFECIAGWGFDFVRLPMSYLTWTEQGNLRAVREATLRDIDQAIEWGRQYGVHVCLNFHRAPGYCVNNSPPEPASLWSDAEIQKVCAFHWATFAKRYRGIPNERLSFNLLNEPANVAADAYFGVVKQLVAAISDEDPKRLVIADGLDWGTKPVAELVPLGIAQSTRGYEPTAISHYRANWMTGSENWPAPQWPVPVGISFRLYGEYKPEFKSPLVLQVKCPEAAKLSVRVAHVSGLAELMIRADGTTVLQQSFTPGPGAGPWKNSVRDQWGSYQADYDATFTADIPTGTREIQLEIGKGDWLTFSEIRISPYPGAPGNVAVIQPTNHDWGAPQDTFVLDANGRAQPLKPRFLCTKATLQERMIEPWRQLQKRGVGVHVGEWGAYNRTPHAVTLAWMRDCLANWKSVGWGWALWNLRGSFGILDSERADVAYEDFQSHKLDRQMLELLRAN